MGISRPEAPKKGVEAAWPGLYWGPGGFPNESPDPFVAAGVPAMLAMDGGNSLRLRRAFLARVLERRGSVAAGETTEANFKTDLPKKFRADTLPQSPLEFKSFAKFAADAALRGGRRAKALFWLARSGLPLAPYARMACWITPAIAGIVSSKRYDITKLFDFGVLFFCYLQDRLMAALRRGEDVSPVLNQIYFGLVLTIAEAFKECALLERALGRLSPSASSNMHDELINEVQIFADYLGTPAGTLMSMLEKHRQFRIESEKADLGDVFVSPLFKSVGDEKGGFGFEILSRALCGGITCFGPPARSLIQILQSQPYFNTVLGNGLRIEPPLLDERRYSVVEGCIRLAFRHIFDEAYKLLRDGRQDEAVQFMEQVVFGGSPIFQDLIHHKRHGADEATASQFSALSHDIIDAHTHTLLQMTELSAERAVKIAGDVSCALTLALIGPIDDNVHKVISMSASSIPDIDGEMETACGGPGTRRDVPNVSISEDMRALSFRQGLNRTEIMFIFRELVCNSVKYQDFAKLESCWVKIHFDRVRRAFVVEDNGIGIADTSKIWEEGFREKRTKRQVDGTGHGLSIVRRRTESLGWKIEVESQVGVGSKFSLICNEGDVVEDPSGDPEGNPGESGALSADLAASAAAASACGHALG